MKLILSPTIRAKLAHKTPPVSEQQVRECFANREGKFLIDTRESNLTVKSRLIVNALFE